MAGGLGLDVVVPTLSHDSIGGPKLQVYEIRDLSRRKVAGKIEVPYPEGQHAGMGISCSTGSNSCLFCVEAQIETSKVDKNGMTIIKSRLQRRYYGYHLDATHAPILYADSVADLSGSIGNDWSTLCAMTNDGRYVVSTGQSGNEIKIVSLKAW
jgi:hypothetical protein